MRRLLWPALASLLGLTFALLNKATSSDIIQNGFEGRDTLFIQGESKAAFRETAHAITSDFARSGQRSEHIQLAVTQGESILYYYNVGKAPVTDDLIATIWVRANRPGVKLLARVVLPQERDPANPSQPLTMLLQGDVYQSTSRWQALGVHQVVKGFNAELSKVRAELKRDVNPADAYVDRVVLNVYCGPGQLDVYLDDLEVGPVVDARQAGPIATTPAVRRPGQTPPVSRRTGTVTLTGTAQQRLYIDGKPFFPIGIRVTGTPLKTLSDALFNTVWFDDSTSPGVIEDAGRLGFWIVPSLTPPALAPRGQATLTANNAFAREIALYQQRDDTLAYCLGGDLRGDDASFSNFVHLSHAYRDADPMRPQMADVREQFKRFANQQVMVGAHRWPLQTSMEMTAYRDWLMQRRLLGGLDTFYWTWVQTHLPDWFTTVAYEKPSASSFTEPIGPQPEQIRQMTYLAIGAGYRGIAYWSDRFLADSHTGRDRLLGLALLNQELKMLEPILVEAEEPEWIDTSDPDVKAAVMRSHASPTLLVLPIWVGKGSQFVPAQGAVANLKIKVPCVPVGCQAWEVSPACVRSLQWTRVLGGNEITIHEFNLTTAVVFTSDVSGLIVKFQKDQREMAPIAAQWAYELAREELAKVERVHKEIEAVGPKLQDGPALLAKAREYLASSVTHRQAGEHGEAYAEAQRAMRPLRILMRVDWERAVKPLDGFAVGSPYAVSFYTLPKHWQFWEQISKMRAAANVLPDGDFELPMDKVPEGWVVQEAPSLDNVEGIARRVSETAHEGKQCLKLEVKPRDPLVVKQILERTYLAIHSPAVRLQPGTLVRISAWVKIPPSISGSPDGAMFFDSAGGEPLAVRLVNTEGWKKLTLYRKVPQSGTINVTMALTGMGAAFFDDVRIEPLVPAGTTTAIKTVGGSTR